MGNANYSLDRTKKRTKGVKISQLNVVSLRKHKIEVAKLLHDYQLDILGLNETRLSKDTCDNEVSIEGYDIHRHDRDSSGGGVAVYVKDTLAYHKRDDIKDPNLEIIGIEIDPKHAKSYIVLCWYRPPTENTDINTFEALTRIIRKLDTEGKEIILTGDTNCDYKKPKDCNTRKLKALYSEFQFEQLITDFTRVATKTSSNGETSTTKTVIDHFSTNRPNLISSSGVIKIGMTDHYMVFGIRKLNANLSFIRKEIKTESRNMKNYNREAFLLDLQTIDWEMIISTAGDEPNAMANKFCDIFHSILDMHAPLKIRKNTVKHAPSPWITPRIRNMIHERDRTKKQAEKDRSIWPKYKRLRNKVTSELRRAVECYFCNLIDENSNNPKEMWKTINRVLNKSQCSTTPRSVMYEGQPIEKQKGIAEAFNNHFTMIGSKLAEKIEIKESDNPLKYFNDKDALAAPNFEFQPITSDLIKNEIKKLKCNKSSGYDKISVQFVKDAAEILCKPLAAIFNSSFKTGVFPDIWKIARVTSIFKSGSKSDMSNYRPISVLSVFSRLLEKLGHDQVSSYMKEQKKFATCQHAFLKMHNTLTSLLNITDSWFSNVDKHRINISVFLDLKKAFDTVDHGILLAKLTKYGVAGTSLRWFTSYLTSRKQYCVLNGHKSSLKTVHCGIPQGSCLGPLLFILYVNDFEQCLKKCTPNMYADDTSVTCSGEDIYDLCNDLKAEIENITEWLRQNKLSLNTAKTEYMVVGHKRQTNQIPGLLEVNVNGEPIKRAQQVKYLGIMVDENLTWNEQYKNLKGKIKNALSSLRRLNNILPQSKLDQVYKALLESHLRYSDELWGNLSNTKLDHLQRLQNRARTLIEGSRLKDGWRCNWLSVSNLIKFDRAVMIYKIINGLCPDSLQGRLVTRSQISNYSTRNYLDLDIPRQNLEFSKKSFFYCGAKAWNEIPLQIRMSSTTTTFKKKLKEYLQN